MAKPTKVFASIAAATLLGVAGLTGCGGESAHREEGTSGGPGVR